MEPIGIYVSVPVACFRVPRAREYFETLPCPPPATVYGMLLSMIGEKDRHVHEGAEIAIALLSEPSYSVVLRTLWRIKKTGKAGPGQGENKRPDFQELLTDVQLAVWIRPGSAENGPLPLSDRVQSALDNPSQISRYGGLSLGESTHLVDEITYLDKEITAGKLLLASTEGDLSLPIWPDHVGSNTRWGQYQLVEHSLNDELPSASWTTIMRPERDLATS